MRRCLKGLGGRPTSTDGFILGPVTRLSGSASFLWPLYNSRTDGRFSVALQLAWGKPPRLSSEGLAGFLLT